MTMNHAIGTALERKLKAGDPITTDDIEQARQYAQAYSTAQAIGLYARVKRQADGQQE
ncbi:hypothetical protein [Sporosarcina highlanderae]|uniref:Uncharacterized protein n=1 Tax=Sporosarcina highlanderae TaxID=3035916 RepID=A0ABT8JU08_9BACL|nr:hypothetical protein [Sporosarcina highlanderae]MDN4608645.1 hypothetical protein [Sporosarcina highlanderae]